jgi:glutaminyl-peptide cyclotransferase
LLFTHSFFKLLKRNAVMTAPRILFSVLCLAVSFVGCDRDHPQPARREQQTRSTVQPPDFSGNEAFDYLLAQTNLGPRNPGSRGHASCLQFLLNELSQFADAVNRQDFVHTGYRGEQIRLTNIIASFNLGARRRILLAAHWDTRPFADQDPNPAKRTQPILGANDGASGVAVLLQLAKMLKQRQPALGVDMVFFDGEDFGRKDDFSNFLLGSKYFASNKSPSFNPEYGILLDMVGDAQLEIRKEKNSLKYAPDVVQYLWAAADKLGLKEFSPELGPELYDDHVPLNEVGIRTVNLIDFEYPDQSHSYWHTTEDTPDKCSPMSLQTVGKLLTYLVYESPL